MSKFCAVYISQDVSADIYTSVLSLLFKEPSITQSGMQLWLHHSFSLWILYAVYNLSINII